METTESVVNPEVPLDPVPTEEVQPQPTPEPEVVASAGDVGNTEPKKVKKAKKVKAKVKAAPKAKAKVKAAPKRKRLGGIKAQTQIPKELMKQFKAEAREQKISVADVVRAKIFKGAGYKPPKDE